jgi:pentatricopeptide repeat protein
MFKCCLINLFKIRTPVLFRNTFFNFSVKKKSPKVDKKKKIRKNSIPMTTENIIVETNEISKEMREEITTGIMNLEIDPLKKNVMTEVDAHNYMKHLDSSFEGFFFKREYNLKNFNYFLQVLVRQNKSDILEEVLNKMEEIGIKPDLISYNQVLTGYAKAKDIEKCEKIFEIIKSKFTPDNSVYNSLLLAYAKNRKTSEALAIFKEMKDEGLEPDIVCYTTLIHAFNLAKNYDKCWQLYTEACLNGQADEFLISYMIRICGSTQNPRKALILLDILEMKGHLKNVLTSNSLLKALSTTKDYAERALDEYIKMKSMGIKPDTRTFVYLLKSTAQLGDIETANNFIREMKVMDIQVTKYHCIELIRTYAGACRIPYVKLEHIESYLKDSWEIMKYIEDNNMPIDKYVLNSMIEIHCAVHKKDIVEGLVLPLFEKHGVEMDEHTYNYIMKMLCELRNQEEVFKLYDIVKQKNLTLLEPTLNYVLESGIRANKIDFIVESLEKFKENNLQPRPGLLRLLTNMEEVPDRLYVELKNWLPYNQMKHRIRQFRPPQFRERSRKLPGIMRKRGKRVKLH